MREEREGEQEYPPHLLAPGMVDPHWLPVPNQITQLKPMYVKVRNPILLSQGANESGSYVVVFAGLLSLIKQLQGLLILMNSFQML